MQRSDREKKQSQVQVVFVTIDPDRDTVDHLASYLGNFDARFIGVVPDSTELEKLKDDFGVFIEYAEPDEGGNYLVTHTGIVYVLDKDGNLRLGFTSGMTSEDIAHDLKILINE